MTTSGTLQEVVFKHMKARKACLLCGGASDGVGVFIPENPQEYLAPFGKSRLIVYPVCEECMAQPEKIELKIQLELLRGYECQGRA